MHMADALISPAVGGAMWAATGATRRLQRPPGAQRPGREQDPADGRRRRLRLRRPDAQLHHPRHRLERPPGRRAAPGDPAGAGGRLPRDGLGPRRAGAVLRRRRAAGPRLQHLQPRRSSRRSSPTRWCTAGSSGAGPELRAGRVVAGACWPAIVGLQLGALGVVLETTASGVTELPFSTFLLLMQPIHLAIGVVEGLVTAAVVLFVYRAQPELLERSRGAAVAARAAPQAAGRRVRRGGRGRRRRALAAGVHAARRPGVVHRRRQAPGASGAASSGPIRRPGRRAHRRSRRDRARRRRAAPPRGAPPRVARMADERGVRADGVVSPVGVERAPNR